MDTAAGSEILFISEETIRNATPSEGLENILNILNASQDPLLKEAKNIPKERKNKEKEIIEPGTRKSEGRDKTGEKWVFSEPRELAHENEDLNLEVIFDSNRVYSRNNPQVERDFIKFLNDIENSDNIFVPQSIKQIVDRENATAPQDREYASVIQSFEKTMEIALENSESMRILLETAGQFFEEFLRRCNDPSLSNTEDMVREMTRDGFIKDDKILIQNNRAFLKKIVKMKKNKKPMENMAIDRMQIIYSMISNIYHARAAHTNKTITVNVTNDKDFRTLGLMFVYEILPRYFAHRTLKKLKKEYAGDIDGFFMANDNKDQEDYLKKTIDLARKYIQDIYEHDKPNVDITKEKIAYILSNDAQNETNTITTIEIISPVVHFLNDIDTYVEGKTEVLKQMILQEGKEKKLTPLEIIEQLEKRDNHNTI